MNKRFLKVPALLVISLALVLVAAGCAAPPGAPPSPASSGRGAPVSIESPGFITRVLTYPGAPYEEIEILQGVLPDDLPADVPIPEGTMIIGSIVRSGKHTSVEIVLDVPQQPEKVLEFYRDSLTGDGWEEKKRPSMGGFVSSQMSSSASFCHEQEISLHVSGYAVSEGEFADVRLHLNDDPQYCKAYTEGPVYPGASPGDILPALSAPEDSVWMSGGGGGGSGDRQYSTASMETNLTTEELQTHYQAQLLETGWKQLEEGAGKTLAWSTWEFADDSGNDWSGLLLVRATDGDYRILYLVADLIP